MTSTPILCVDFGSTFTKAALVDAATGVLIATGSHPTTIGTDLMEALDALRAGLARETGDRRVWPVRACSSAGGGLRVAVVGNEELVTSEAGERVATSSGGRVVHVASGTLDAAAVWALTLSEPDLVLLVGGTDGGNTRVLRSNAHALAEAGPRLPVVVAGNVACRDEVAEILTRSGRAGRAGGAGARAGAVIVTDNVLPEIGVVRPEPARAAIREMFVRHVIGGKHLSRRKEFAEIVRGATPDLVLRGVEVLARASAAGSGAPGGVVVVDVGGATTDVHSVLEPDPEDGALRREVVGTLPVSRTVEGDLGLRWNARGIVHAAVKENLLPVEERESLDAEAKRRNADPAFVATTQDDLDVDERLTALAVKLSLRRHVGRTQLVTGSSGPEIERKGKDLREVRLLVGSGGPLRHGGVELTARVLRAALAGEAGNGRLVPERPLLGVDAAYVLAAVGLLADDHPVAAATLASRVVDAV